MVSARPNPLAKVAPRLPTRATRLAAAIAVGLTVAMVVVGLIGRHAEFETADGPITVECGSPLAPADLASLGLSPAGSDELVATNALAGCGHQILMGRWIMAMLLAGVVGCVAYVTTRPEPPTVFRGDPII